MNILMYKQQKSFLEIHVMVFSHCYIKPPVIDIQLQESLQLTHSDRHNDVIGGEFLYSSLNQRTSLRGDLLNRLARGGGGGERTPTQVATMILIGRR